MRYSVRFRAGLNPRLRLAESEFAPSAGRGGNWGGSRGVRLVQVCPPCSIWIASIQHNSKDGEQARGGDEG